MISLGSAETRLGWIISEYPPSTWHTLTRAAASPPLSLLLYFRSNFSFLPLSCNKVAET